MQQRYWGLTTPTSSPVQIAVPALNLGSHQSTASESSRGEGCKAVDNSPWRVWLSTQIGSPLGGGQGVERARGGDREELVYSVPWAAFGTSSQVQSSDKKRLQANDPATVQDRFKKLQRLKEQYRISNSNVYKMDEKGFLLEFAARSKVICRYRGYKQSTKIAKNGTWELITVLECILVN